MRLRPILMAGAATIAVSGLSVMAADAATDKVDLVTWSQKDLYNGWTAERLLDQDVYGQNGDQAGEVDNLVIGPKGQIQSVIVASGGFLDIGDTEYAVPWSKVRFSDGMDHITVPVTADNISKYSVFQEGIEGDQRGFRATELIGDYVSLKDVAGYGLVRDLVFNDGGHLQAVVVSPDVAYGVGGAYAYPYYGYGYGWQPGANYYNLPYSRHEISQLGPFDYSKLQHRLPTRESMQPQTDEQNQG